MANIITKHIPNSITCCNLICGCIATSWALSGNYKMALVFIICCAIFDFFDGMTARLLHVSSEIGKELDSLADVVTFGVAPASMVYTLLYDMHYPSSMECCRQWLPYVAFLIAAFSALRLAKFNLDTRQTTSFIGLPTPANALFWGSLIVGADSKLSHLSWGLPLVLVLIILSCWILISEIPMFALKFKQWGWHGNEVKYIFLITCIPLLIFLGISAFAVIITWYVILSIYVASRKGLK